VISTSSYTAWAIHSTYHTLLKALPGVAIFGQDMLFDISFIADWKKNEEHGQRLTDLNSLTVIDGHDRHFLTCFIAAQ
jgi:hypothetical protein